MNAIERVIPAAPTPEWWMRMMWDHPHYESWCAVDAPEIPHGFDRAWGCYRQQGHTGRHLGLASVADDRSRDAWVVWP